MVAGDVVSPPCERHGAHAVRVDAEPHEIGPPRVEGVVLHSVADDDEDPLRVGPTLDAGGIVAKEVAEEVGGVVGMPQ